MKYPKIGSTSKIPANIKKGRGLCKCGAKAEFVVDIQWDVMRGNDSVKKSCKVHKDDLVYLLDT